jgi:hypothetical protein
MDLMPAKLNMSHCGPRMEIVRELDLKAPLPDCTKILNGLGVAPKSPYAPLHTLGFVLDLCLNVGIFQESLTDAFCVEFHVCVVIRGVHGAVY